ncbi:hypothetical protein [Thermophilibacter mediterraneus]|uniref:hypothetical protein n=1 Tax=Thermophilibacter mediterraneus TaxID=1871031 RepID=UPI00235686A4|nr:hypothetical protein [Thermophilibacter mediterraneus]
MPPLEKPRKEPRRDDARMPASDPEERFLCRDIVSRVRRWKAEGRPVRRKGA